jgi:hypothetical protein
VIAVGFLQRQAIVDWARLRNYQPSAEVAALVSRTTMDAKAKHIFYVAHPQLSDRDTFSSQCPGGEETIVLGCYVSNLHIYIFNVSDPRLEGVREVTAAHEMLHAAYARLSGKERARIDALTAQTFDSLQDSRVQETIAAYRAKDASVVPDELHSILGTEVRNLPPELETYYKRYFINRSVVVAFSEKYEAVFGERKALEDSYVAQLKQLQDQIDADNAQIKSDEQALQNEFAQLESRRNEADPAQFNTRAAAYNAKVRSFNAQVAAANRLIDQYNVIYEKYKAIVLEENDLVKAIDSRPSAISTQ